MRHIASRAVEPIFNVVQAINWPNAAGELGADRRQVDDPRDAIGADGGCRGLAEPVLEGAEVVRAVAWRRYPEQGVHVLRRPDKIGPIVQGADGHLGPRAR